MGYEPPFISSMPTHPPLQVVHCSPATITLPYVAGSAVDRPLGASLPSAVEWRKAFTPVNVYAGRYIYMEDLQNLDKCRDPVQWPTCPSPVRLNNWTAFLHCHPDQTFVSYIHSGLSSGFRIGYNRQAPSLKTTSRNHPSAFENASVVRSHINAEVQAGRLVGPLKQALTPLLHTSPIGLVPKAHQPGKWRLIVDLSFPRDHSANEGISLELASMSYARVDDAVELIRHLGVGTQLVKLDLKSAYRIVPIHPQDHHILAIEWEGATYVDQALSFGLRSAPKIFSAVADMIA